MKARRLGTISILVLIPFMLNACGGGGDSGEVPVPEGPQKPVRASVSMPTSEPLLITSETVDWLPAVALEMLWLPPYLAVETISNRAARETIDETHTGSSGGAVAMAGVLQSSGSWVYYEFSSYREQDDVILEGAILEEVLGSGTYLFSFYDFSLTDSFGGITVNGTIESKDHGREYRANLKISYNGFHDDLYLDDVQIRDDLQEQKVAYSGRAHIGRSSHERFDVRTPDTAPLQWFYANDFFPFHSGKVEITGDATSSARMEFPNHHFIFYELVNEGGTRSKRLENLIDQTVASALSRLDRPVATAVFNRAITHRTGTRVRLDGRFSVGRPGRMLQHEWKILARPAGSNAVLVDANKPVSSIVVDKPGTYAFSLTVNDGGRTAIDTVEITVSDNGHDWSVPSGTDVQLLPDPSDVDSWVVDGRIYSGYWPHTENEWDDDGDEMMWDTEWYGSAPYGFSDRRVSSLNLMSSEGGHIGGEPAYVAWSPVRHSFNRILDKRGDLRVTRSHRLFDMHLPGHGASLFSAEIADIDGDGYVDVIATPLFSGGEETHPVGVHIAYGKAAGQFQLEHLDIGNSSRFVLEDLDGDGHQDVIAVGDCGLEVLFGAGGRSFESKLQIPQVGECVDSVKLREGKRTPVVERVGEGIAAIWVVSLDGQNLERITVDSAREVISHELVPVNFELGGSVRRLAEIALIDIDDDGHADIALRFLSSWGTSGDGVVFLMRKSDEEFAVGDFIRVDEGGIDYIAVGDFDGNGKNEIATAGNEELVIWRGSFDGPQRLVGFRYQDMGDQWFAPEGLAFMDTNGDGKQEVLVINSWVAIAVKHDIAKPATGELDIVVMKPYVSWGRLVGSPKLLDWNNNGKLDLLLPFATGVDLALRH